MIFLDAAATLVCPVVLGLFVGRLVRWCIGRRLADVAGAIACLLLPTALATVVTVYFPAVGLWDGVTEGVLCGAGILWAAHHLCADPRHVALAAGAFVAGFVFLEVAVRLFLGTPTAYPVEGGPHFFLADALRTTAPDAPVFRREGIPDFLARNALRADLARPGEDTPPTERPPAPMLTTELVCSIVYGAAYHGVLDVSREHTVIFPDRFTPRPDAARHVLHIGDSMVFGANVPREQTFTADLEKLEPDTQHINGGISGMAPDDYLVLLSAWLDRHHVDLAVMYLFAGNDLSGLDAPHPCSNWQSLLVYEGVDARLRFPDAPRSDGEIGLTWLLINSPLPYLGRALIVAHSAAAAFMGSALASWSALGAHPNFQQVAFNHLESILRSARDHLRERHIPFVVVVLPSVEAMGRSHDAFDFATQVLAIARRLGVPALDATDPIRDALARGENPVQGDHSHFNEAGHWLMANWLHERLATAAGIPVQ
jgi:hypothetical protein